LRFKRGELPKNCGTSIPYDNPVFEFSARDITFSERLNILFKLAEENMKEYADMKVRAIYCGVMSGWVTPESCECVINLDLGVRFNSTLGITRKTRWDFLWKLKYAKIKNAVPKGNHRYASIFHRFTSW